MPSSMTHTYFGIETLKKLPTKYQNKIKDKEEYFKLFCQGPDPFMFYHFFIGKKAKYGKHIQSKMHFEKTRDFFLNTITTIKEKELTNNKEAIAFLYGYICHYFLDLTTHPYIYYKGGIFKKDKKETYKYNCKHQKIEYIIDQYMISIKEQEPPHRFKTYQHIFKVNTFHKELTEVINEVIDKTYNIKEITPFYLKSIKHMKSFFHLINYDPTGIKLHIYKIIDKITPPYFTKLEELSYHQDVQKYISYLNLNHIPWNLPWDKDQIFNDSFIDLYNKALTKSTETIIKVTNILEKDTINKKELEEIFQDLSYATGLPCHKKVKMKYFEQ